jgi:hypothetical protein
LPAGLVFRQGQLLIDHPRAIAQFAALERRTFPSGKDKVDHPPKGHDDLSNAIAGAAVLASQKIAEPPVVVPYVSGQPLSVPGATTTAKFYEWMNSQSSNNNNWGPV